MKPGTAYRASAYGFSVGQGISSQDFPSSDAPIYNGKRNYRFLLLSTSLLVDRVFRYTNLINQLTNNGEVEIWTSSFDHADQPVLWNRAKADVQPFPEIRPFREFPHNYARRLNEFVWDYRYMPPSRMSIMKHRRDKQQGSWIRPLKLLARFLALLRTEGLLERRLASWLSAYPRSPEAKQRLQNNRPDVIVSTGLFQFEQPGIFSAAKKLNIPTIAYIPSWDNISTKNRMVFNYDAYIVWNNQSKDELHEFYPQTKERPVYVVGAPQFDIFRQEKFYQSRRDFCSTQGLDPDLPIILYGVGSPNFLKEHHGALHLAKRIANGDLGNVQMLVRPHPIHDNAEMKELFEHYEPITRLQKTPNAGRAVRERAQEESQIIAWLNSFRHADVVVNLSSTVVIDAAIFDTPVVNLDFDPQPGQADQHLIKEINHEWTHFKPVAESGGLFLVNDFDEMIEAIKAYLAHPELHRVERRKMTEYVCGYLDGKCGERMANSILDFAVMRRSQK